MKTDAVPELSPAKRRGEAFALGLRVSMKVQIFFSTQILASLQQSSLLQELQLTTDNKKRLQGILSLGLYYDHTKLVKGRQNNHFKQQFSHQNILTRKVPDKFHWQGVTYSVFLNCEIDKQDTGQLTVAHPWLQCLLPV